MDPICREQNMREALCLAEEAARQGEIPVGCVITDAFGRIIGRGRNRRIIGRGRNRREERHDATAHAELEAIREACASLGDWRLDRCSLYVTLEPCPMCAGAIINARIPRVVFGAREENTGSCGSVIDLFSERYGHSPAVFSGVCEQESRELLQGFFQQRRS